MGNFGKVYTFSVYPPAEINDFATSAIQCPACGELNLFPGTNLTRILSKNVACKVGCWVWPSSPPVSHQLPSEKANGAMK